VAVGTYDGSVIVMNADTKESIANHLPRSGSEITSVAFSPDGKRVVAGSNDRTIIDASLDSGDYYTFVGNHDAVTDVAYSPDGQRIISSSSDESLRVWNASDVSLSESELTRHPQRSLDLVMSGLEESALFQQNALLEQALAEKTGHTTPTGPPKRINGQPGSSSGDPRLVTSNVAFTGDHQRYASATEDGIIHIRNVADNAEVVNPLVGNEDWVFGLAFSHDGQQLVSGGADGRVRLWNASTGHPIRELLLDGPQLIRSVAISPDGRRVAAGLNDGTLRMWDVGDGHPIGGPMTGHHAHEGVGAVAFSPDGKVLVSGSDDKTLRIWDGVTGRTMGGPLTGHSDAVYAVAVSHDGTKIVSGGADKTLRVWDVATQQPVGSPLTGHTQAISRVEFNDDDATILSEDFPPVGTESYTRSWPGPKAWADTLCSKLTVNMTRQRWREWIDPGIDYRLVCPRLPEATGT
jgi:WD40 repeat protein